MTAIRYPLIVSDFDGTLVNSDGTICDKNKKAIDDYRKAGGAFALSTGRIPAGILPRAKELGLNGMLATCQGAIILDIQSEKVVSEGRIPFETTLEIVEKMEELGLHIHIYDLWTYYSNMDDDALRYYENAVRNKAILITDRPLSEFVKEKKFASYKVLAMVRPEDGGKTIEALNEAKFSGCCVTRSADVLVEVVNAQYSKGTAIDFLANYYGTTAEQTIAIGDQLNDLPMIEKAGLGVAVNNADEGLKARAKFVSNSTNEEGAVAEIIEKFGLMEV